MCEKCAEIDRRIERFKVIVARFIDEHMTKAVGVAITDLEAQKAALHPKQK
jgi:hypothetical protein